LAFSLIVLPDLGKTQNQTLFTPLNRVPSGCLTGASFASLRFKFIFMIDNDFVIIENKTVENLLPIHEAQLLTYLKLSNLNLGFLLNWNVTLMKDGIKRMVNNLK
jgi:hypothetical protein